MYFPKSALTFVVAIVAGPLSAAAFSTGGAFVVKTNNVALVNSAIHPAVCGCTSCGKTSLSMSEAATEEVPAEVSALDGVADGEEAHNVDRPARGSGIQKHKKENKGIALADLEIGSMVEGKVKTITSYGAFVDIGASTDALLHVSRLSDSFVSNVEDIVKAGDSVSVRIVTVDAEKGQVALSMLSEEAEEKAAAAKEARSAGGKRKARPQRSNGDRQAQVATLNSLAEAGYDGDKFVEGEVVSMLDFGAFVRFDATQLDESVTGELDGLVHISSLCSGRAEAVSDIVSVGDKVQIRVKNLDTEGNKVSLSMITREQEQANRPKRGDNDGKGRRRGRQMFSESEMGAKDWKESVEKLQATQPTFTNTPVVVDNRA